MMGIARSGGRFGACILALVALWASCCPSGTRPIGRGNADRDHYQTSLARSLAARRFRFKNLDNGQVAKSVSNESGLYSARTCRRPVRSEGHRVRLHQRRAKRHRAECGYEQA